MKKPVILLLDADNEYRILYLEMGTEWTQACLSHFAQ